MPAQCPHTGDLHLQFLGSPVITADWNDRNRTLVNVIVANGDAGLLERMRVWVTLDAADARRLYEALGAVLNSEVRADA